MNEALPAGSTLSHYRIVSKIGAGGMGEVYLAQDTKLDRKVALKVLPADVASDRDRMERFVREAKAAAALNHPNIAHVYEIGESNGTHFIAMEFVDGVTLREKIHHEETSLAKLLKYLTQVAEGLNKAHSAGIVHRDLKPDNIMITRDDYAKVLDFGLAKLVEPQKSFGSSGSSSSEIVTAMMQQQSIAGMVIGTIGYMSPEQASGRVHEIDHRSDIFSFGCILFEAATGHKAFEGKDALDSLHKIVHAPTPLLRDANPLAPDDLQRVVRRCLAKEADKRYQSMKEVAIELEDLQQELKGQIASDYSDRAASLTSLRASGAARVDEGFWVAVLPFKYHGSNVDLELLAEGLSEQIVTGLSRFSYLRVIARSSTLGFISESGDIRSVGRDLGARYVMEGSLRQAGSILRVAVQLVDATSGAHLWAETYDRPFNADEIFAIQDDLVPRIVSTVADQYGVLPHSICEALRGRDTDELSPYEVLMRFFDYTARFSPESHAETRANLEQVVQKVSSPADCWAMLSDVYADEHKFGFNPQPDSLRRALAAARRAVEFAPSNSFAHLALAQALFFSKDFGAFRTAAERALALNPMDGGTAAYMGTLIAFTGDWEKGCQLVERATQMNPHHPGWYWTALVHRQILKGDFREALNIALRINMPGFLPAHIILAAVYGQLGDHRAADKARQELLGLMPEVNLRARDELSKWYLPDLVERLIDGLRKAGLEIPDVDGAATSSSAGSASGQIRSDEGFWVAVLPFRSSGTSLEVKSLAEGLSEDIVTGLSRFSYLRVIARGSTLHYANQTTDLREVGKELGARYVMEGNLRQAGTRMRVAVQLVDAINGAHLWAETYERSFSPESVFELQDELVPRIVSTVADLHGVLPHTMSAAVRVKPPDQLSPYEAVLRSFAYSERVTADELADALTCLELAAQKAPNYADALAILASLYTQDYGQGFELRADPLLKGESVARKAVEVAPSNHLAWFSLAQVLFFQKEFQTFTNAAERSVALNPMDGNSIASLGEMMTFSGNSERGLELVERAKHLNPNHPGWYWYANFHLAYSQRDYQNALDFALKVNLPSHWVSPATIAAAYGQLGQREAAAKAVRDMIKLRPEVASTVRMNLEKWWTAEDVEHFIDGLRKAGLKVVDAGGLETKDNQSAIRFNFSATTSLLVLPFTNNSADEENEYFCDGLTEELISDLSKVRSLRVISRNSAMRLKGTAKDTKTIASELNVQYVLDGSVRKAGQSLRISVELIDGVADANLWSEKYQGTLDDIFEMQESVSRSIVEALKITLSDDEQQQMEARPIADPRAYDLYLKARAQFLQGAPSALDRAIELLKQGLGIIGENELLYAALGYSYYFCFRWITKLDENYLQLANECMEKTFALNPSSSHGLTLKGLLSYSRGDITEAIRSLKQAIAVQPTNTEALFWLTVNSDFIDDYEAAMKYADEVRALDPLLPINTLIKGVVYVYNGEFSEALVWTDRGLAMDPSSPILIWSAAIVKAWCGKTDEAIAHIDDLVQFAPDWVYTQHGRFLKHAMRGEKELGLQYATTELVAEARHDCHFALHVAHCFALIRENEKALDFLELAVRNGMLNYRFLGEVDPLLENIRNEERFRKLMQEARRLSRESAVKLGERE